MKIRLFTIPNLLTLANLLCGTVATVVVLTAGDLELAFWLLVVAAVCDFFDGFVARLLHQASPIGLQLDSLADMVSSGIAPAAIMLTLAWHSGSSWWLATPDTLRGLLNPDSAPWAFTGSGAWSWLVLLIPVGTALRLARFNIDDTQRSEFLGLPSPAAGLFCASLGLLAARDLLHLPLEGIILTSAITAWLMISPIRMFALKFHGFGWQGNEVRYGFLAACLVVIFALRTYAIPVIFVLYVAVSLVRWLMQGRTADNN